MPVRFAIVGPHHLLPEADMTYDFATETGESDRKGGDAFAIRCNSNGGDTACGTDADADGEHSDWDCDDADPAVYRGASDATGGVDWNCDGFLLQVSCDVGSPP